MRSPLLHEYGYKIIGLLEWWLGVWARRVLRRWRPQVVVVTGSTGKTTVLHLLEAQLGDRAVYSHHANSALGLPSFILGMTPNVSSKFDMLKRLLTAPFHSFRRLPSQKILIAEADCVRPHEGKFMAKLLKPEVTIWVSVYRTHTMNYDRQVKKGKFASHEAAVANEFGYLPEGTSRLVVANGDQPLLVEQLKRVPQGVTVETKSLTSINSYRLTKDATEYELPEGKISLPGLYPKDVGVSLQLVHSVLNYLKQPLEPTYKALVMPPGRSNVLKGKQNLTLVDSTYNTGLGATQAVMTLFEQLPAKEKWLILGDMLELGNLEAEEHRQLGEIVAGVKLSQVVLVGPRTKKYTLPYLQEHTAGLPVVGFEGPKEVLDYLNQHLKGGETLLFKGGRFLEGVIEQLLADPADAAKLPRRGPAWVKRRQEWGLPQ